MPTTSAPITVEIFVGADNATHLVDRDTVRTILDARHDGWTLTVGEGSWHGMHEESVRVVVSDQREAVLATMRALRDTLAQEAVAYREISPLQFV